MHQRLPKQKEVTHQRKCEMNTLKAENKAKLFKFQRLKSRGSEENNLKEPFDCRGGWGISERKLYRKCLILLIVVSVSLFLFV